jgi:hypothetical protein
MKRCAWLAILAACGTTRAAAPDGADGVITDADTDAPVTGPITIRVIDELTDLDPPLANAPIVVMDRAGATLSIERTNAAGEATFVIPRDAMITVVNDRPGSSSTLLTIVDVQPGDALVIGQTDEPRPWFATMTAAFPRVAGTVYHLATRCGDSRDQSVFVLDDRCATGTFDAYVMVDATTPTTYGVGRWTSATGVTAVNNGIVTPSTVWQDAVPITTALVPDAQIIGTTAMVSETVDTGFIAADSKYGALSAGRYSSTHTLIPIPNAELWITLHASRSGLASQRIFAREPYGPQFTYDLTASPVPWLTTDRADVTDRTVAWTPAATNAPDPDVVAITTRWSGDRWTVIGPSRLAAPNAFVFPSLPAELAHRDWKATDWAHVDYIDLEGQTWDQVRAGITTWFRLTPGNTRVDWRVAPPGLTRVWHSTDTFDP